MEHHGVGESSVFARSVGQKLAKIKAQMIHTPGTTCSTPWLSWLREEEHLPSRATEMAKGMRCDACKEAKRPMAPPPAGPVRSTGRGRVRDSERRWQGEGSAHGFLPSARSVQGSVGANEPEYHQRHLVTPAEAHHLLGVAESIIGRLKDTVEKLAKEGAGRMATTTSSRAATRQWTHGGSFLSVPSTSIMLVWRKAQAAYQKANQAMAKLRNTTGRPVEEYKAGDLVMPWRQRQPGKLSGRGSDCLIAGNALVKAWTNQVRRRTRREAWMQV